MCIRKNNGLPKDVHALIPRTCVYLTLQDKGEFTGVIKDMDLEMERIPWVIWADRSYDSSF